jgi:hypothetical protein
MPEYDVTPVWDNDLDHSLHHLDDWMDMEAEYQTFNDISPYGDEMFWDEASIEE